MSEKNGAIYVRASSVSNVYVSHACMRVDCPHCVSVLAKWLFSSLSIGMCNEHLRKSIFKTSHQNTKMGAYHHGMPINTLSMVAYSSVRNQLSPLSLSHLHISIKESIQKPVFAPNKAGTGVENLLISF